MNANHLHDIEGLQFMPIKKTKVPIIKGWQTSMAKHDMSDCEAVGLVCGGLSGGLEVIDCDEKYSLDGKLFETYKRFVHEADPSLLKKLVVQKTKNGGYHLIYRCSKIEGNLKLANRPTTPEEKLKTYGKNIAIQGEIVGPKINGGRLKITDFAFKVFNIWDIDKACYMTYDEVTDICTKFGLQQVELIFRGMANELELTTKAFVAMAVAQTYGKDAESNDIKAEGIVVKTNTSFDRTSFKVISHEYLLEHDL